jgi:uncharacterized protein (TIGR00730 family)
MKNICVFCSSREEVSIRYKEVATKCGELIAQHGLTLIYGGSNAGLMARVSNAVMDNGGKVMGVYPEILSHTEPFNPRVSVPVIVNSMTIRKDVMMSNADAFIILPGGVGTLDELFGVLTLKVLEGFDKPVMIVNTDGFWEKLKDLCNYLAQEMFVVPYLFDMYRMVDTPEEAFKRLGFVSND